MTHAIITQLNKQRFLLIYEEDVLVECHPLVEAQSLQIGNIYIGKVEKVVKNIQSAFIRLDTEHVGYLPLNDKPALVLNRQLPKGLLSIAEGDRILVQVEQEPQKMKQAKVTGNVCLNGNYIALDMISGHIGVSKKIKNAERVAQLKALISSEQNAQYGCVLRTACENASNEAVLSEYRHFVAKMEEIHHKAQFERNIGCIEVGKSEYVALLNDYGIDRIDEIKTDLSDVYQELTKIELTANTSLVFYDDTEYPLYKLLSLESEIKKLLNKKVWLKSGGFLIIEPTEAMVVIDVNTGKSIGKKDKERHILKLNLEAADEITKQLRLRNLSGIIMIDFINMTNSEDKQQVVKCIERGLIKDKIPGYFVEITKLDVFELTRKKVRKPLHEIISSLTE